MFVWLLVFFCLLLSREDLMLAYLLLLLVVSATAFLLTGIVTVGNADLVRVSLVCMNSIFYTKSIKIYDNT